MRGSNGFVWSGPVITTDAWHRIEKTAMPAATLSREMDLCKTITAFSKLIEPASLIPKFHF